MPPATPVTVPVREPTDATHVGLLLQVPPTDVHERDVVVPAQMGPRLPVMAAGEALTVTVSVETVVPWVQVIIAVPTDTPVTAAQDVPVGATVATATLLLLQVAAVVIVVSPQRIRGVPMHTMPQPEIAANVFPPNNSEKIENRINKLFFIKWFY
mgnify:CR=1 FL=1